MVAGQEVVLNGDLQVAHKTTATVIPIGIVDVGGADSELVTVATNFQRTLKGTAKLGAFTAGDLVVPNGTVGADGVPEYVAAVATNYAQAIVIKGGIADAQVELGILRSPILL